LVTRATRTCSASTGDVIELVDAPLPPIEYSTFALWVELPAALKADLASLSTAEFDRAAVHAAEHALVGLAPLIVPCDADDLGMQVCIVRPCTARPCVAAAISGDAVRSLSPVCAVHSAEGRFAPREAAAVRTL
jgi:hypothetical protein